MTELTLILPTIGQPDRTEDPKIVTALQTIETWADGNIDSTNFPKAVSTTTLAAPYTARVSATLATEHPSPSSSRPVQMNIDMQLLAVNSFGINARVHIGGVIVSEYFCNESVHGGIRVGGGFILAPGEKWEVESGGTEAGGAKIAFLTVSYRVL